jgi:hypothetical protein
MPLVGEKRWGVPLFMNGTHMCGPLGGQPALFKVSKDTHPHTSCVLYLVSYVAGSFPALFVTLTIHGTGRMVKPYSVTCITS